MLVCDNDHTASKAYAPQKDGSWKMTADYDAGFWFRPIPHECDDLHALAGLFEVIRERGNAIVVRGELDEAGHAALAADPEHRIVRRKNAKPDNIPPHLTEAPRAWVLLDVDDWPLPPGACLRVDPAAVIEEAIQALLPEPFHDAECYWQLSSSAGFVPGVLKVHLCYWLSEAQDNAYLRAWFKHFAPYIDIARDSARFSRITLLIPRLNAAMIRFLSEPVGDMARYRQSPCPPCRMWRIASHTRTCIPRIPRLARLVCTPQASPTPWRGWRWRPIGRLRSTSLAASMQYAMRVHRGGTRNDEKFIADLGVAIEAAPKRELRVDVTGYLDDVYLHRIIDGAFHLIDNAAKSDAADEPDDPVPVRLPAGFGMTKSGLYFTDQAKDDAEPMWVSQQFIVLGEARKRRGVRVGHCAGMARCRRTSPHLDRPA